MLKSSINADFCVIGGGMAGLCASIAAARGGIKTVLVNNRPVLGGNASSEIRMWICGAHGENNHETGILEEILLENAYRNTNYNYSIWDSVLYEKAQFQENLSLILNCHIHEVEMVAESIRSVRGIQLSTETEYSIQAKYFADCTGDGLIGDLAGAEFRMGREAAAEFGESIAPIKSDKKTMGLSCLFQVRETLEAQKFIPPIWAYKYLDDNELPMRDHLVEDHQNFWWIETGGMGHSIHDTEGARNELLKIVFGVWDHIKNYGDHGAENWVIEWIGFWPGKRESRRFIGDHILTQNDIESEGRHFTDTVAFGGWTMDDHYPEAFYKKEAGTIFHPAPSPYCIPYRCLYSKNIDNLFFAGRNISATHSAISSTRVMATCSVIGQAVGTAAALAVKNQLTPRQVYSEKISELQQILMHDDCYLPFIQRKVNSLTQTAKFSAEQGDPSLLKNGYDRKIAGNSNSWDTSIGDSLIIQLARPSYVKHIRLVLDSDLSRPTKQAPSYYPLDFMSYPEELRSSLTVPASLIKAFTIDIITANDEDGNYRTVASIADNHQRLIYIAIEKSVRKIKITPLETWGSQQIRIFSCDIIP